MAAAAPLKTFTLSVEFSDSILKAVLMPPQEPGEGAPPKPDPERLSLAVSVSLIGAVFLGDNPRFKTAYGGRGVIDGLRDAHLSQVASGSVSNPWDHEIRVTRPEEMSIGVDLQEKVGTSSLTRQAIGIFTIKPTLRDIDGKCLRVRVDKKDHGEYTITSDFDPKLPEAEVAAADP